MSLKSNDIHFQRLKAEFKNFTVSYDTARKTAKKLKQKYITPFNCYLPLSHRAGEAQADFFDCSFIEKGQQINGYAFILSFPYSNAAFAQVFKGKTAECMLQGMKNIFEYIGGVPHTIWFDNDVSIVNVKEDKSRNFHDFFLHFKNHYKFSSRFCNLRSPNEKGNAEANVRTLRNNLFVPLPQFGDLDEFNKLLLNQCQNVLSRTHYLKETAISSLFQQDKNNCRILPTIPFITYLSKTRKVNKVGRIVVNRNHYYFIGSQYRGQNVRVEITYKQIIIYDVYRQKEITRFPRDFGNNYQYKIDWNQYLPILAVKLRGLDNTDFLESLPQEIRQDIISADKNTARNIIKGIVNEDK